MREPLTKEAVLKTLEDVKQFLTNVENHDTVHTIDELVTKFSRKAFEPRIDRKDAPSREADISRQMLPKALRTALNNLPITLEQSLNDYQPNSTGKESELLLKELRQLQPTVEKMLESFNADRGRHPRDYFAR